MIAGRVQRGDLYGGLTAAVIALPLALAFGVSAYAPLGPELASTGALVGLLGAIFTGFFASLFGGTPAQVSGPTGPMSMIVTLFVAETMQGRTTADVPLVVTLTAFMIAFGGGIQIVIGWLGGGKLVRYIPYPVIAGFMNGIALIIFLGQIKPFLGLHGGFGDFEIATAWVPMVIGTVTIVAIVGAKRITKSVPGSLVGLFVGIAVYLGIAALGYAPLRAESNTLLIGPIPNPFTSFDHLPLLQLGSLGDISPIDLRRVLSTAVTLAVLGSIDTLLTSVVADVVTNTKHDSKKELFGQGIGNIVSGLLGGLAGAGATVRTLVNINAGGRTRHAGMIHAGVMFVVAIALGWPAGWIPRAALAGILIVTAYGIVDRYSLGLFRRRLVRNEFALMLAVAGVTVVVDLMLAVAIGIGTAAMLFIVQQLKTGISVRRLRGNELFSRVGRSPSQRALLQADGSGTVIFQLRGALFFGTTDTVSTTVDAELANAKRIVVDLAGVRDIDLSGAQLLLQLVERCRAAGKQIAFSGLGSFELTRPGLHERLSELGVFDKVGKDCLHRTLDHALEDFEDEILALHGEPSTGTVELAHYEVLSELTPDEVRLVGERLVERTLGAGEVLCQEHAPAEEVVLVRRGRLALISSTQMGETRVAVFGPGAVYGARALLASTAWAGSLRAEVDAAVYLLPRAAVVELAGAHPRIAEHLQQGLLRTAMLRMDTLRSELVWLED